MLKINRTGLWRGKPRLVVKDLRVHTVHTRSFSRSDRLQLGWFGPERRPEAVAELLPPSARGEAFDTVTGSVDILEQEGELRFVYIPEGGIASSLERLGFCLKNVEPRVAWVLWQWHDVG